jgi:hypothetical protein
MVNIISPNCAKCPVEACYPRIKVDGRPVINKAPNYCPMKNLPDLIEKTMVELRER